MNSSRIPRILSAMKERNLTQMIVSDPAAIFYLTGKWIHPGERMLALYLNISGDHKLIINRLFPQEGDCGAELVWYDDTEDAVEILSRYTEKDRPLGIDKTWPSGFLLRLQELNGASSYCNSSSIVDDVRRIKDAEEQQRMRDASLANDRVMERLIPLTGKGYSEKELDRIVRELYAASGHSDVSFPPITAYGKSGADPHHSTDSTCGKRGDSVVLDIGGILNHYCSDMTRTVFLGEVSDKAREVYEIVREAQQRGIDAARPGARMCDVDNACRSYITEKGYGDYSLTERDILSVSKIMNPATSLPSIRTSFSPDRFSPLNRGSIVPGRRYRVRIEDLVLITEDGCEVLNHYPKDLIIVPFE